jgi:hypothetical protein
MHTYNLSGHTSQLPLDKKIVGFSSVKVYIKSYKMQLHFWANDKLLF